MEKEVIQLSVEQKTLEVTEEESQVQASGTKSADNQDTQATREHLCASADCTLKGAAKKAVLCAVVVLVWMLLALATVMFYIPQVQSLCMCVVAHFVYPNWPLDYGILCS